MDAERPRLDDLRAFGALRRQQLLMTTRRELPPPPTLGTAIFAPPAVCRRKHLLPFMPVVDGISWITHAVHGSAAGRSELVKRIKAVFG